MSEKIQAYNDRNKCFVLMQAGRVIDNRKDQYDGVPLVGGKNEAEKSTQTTEPEAGQPEPPRENEENEKLVDQENGQDNDKNPWAWW